MPSWETIGVIVGYVAVALAALTVFSVVGAWFVTELIKTIRHEWEKADPARKEKGGKQ